MRRIAGGIGMGLLLLGIVLVSASPSRHASQLAGRYNLRQRTTQFFERASTPAPSVKPATSSEPVRLSKAKQPQSV